MAEVVNQTTSNATSRGQHRSRGRRGRGTPGPHHNQSRTSNNSGRTFGGQLTRLQADAPAFVPASIAPVAASTSSPRSSTTPATNTPQSHSHRHRRASLARSTAPDLPTRIHDDISHGIYECAICSNEVARSSKIWSCRTCWTVFHIGCIKKWSKNEGSAVARASTENDSEIPVGRLWRCPGCNLPKDVTPTSYTCWCEKEIDPKAIGGVPPHSCGQTCGKERRFPKTCPHPCDLICHAGPCPPCSAMGGEQSCFCGKKSTNRRCVETNYETGWSCGEICGDVMPCGEHTCQRPCHEGFCGACSTEVEAQCYCGKSHKAMQCAERDEEKESYDWIGCFDCHNICGRSFDCGVHKCEKTCHPQDSEQPQCPRSPDVVTRCPCGKTQLGDLNVETRRSCSDPIPSCDKPCGKSLACGHPCTQICHTGECLPCLKTVQIHCRCGRNSFSSICHQGTIEPPQCLRVCKATLSCGRHECGERCCPGEKKAHERQATKRKLKPLGTAARIFDEGIEAEHICTKSCGRSLKCGNHNCTELCHKGPCPGCKEAIFEDISCDCGRTILQAPLPCGTKPPPCNFPCHRAKDCGHPQVAHNCHLDEEGCPKCPFLTEKQCLCGKQTLKNQPCWRSDVFCGLVCGKLLKCGAHMCRKTCHKPGECEDALQPCQQECGKPKKTCGHPCEQQCHAPSICKEDKPCPLKVFITCDCQRKKEEVRCNARKDVPEPTGRQTSLKCDDECARLERNRQLKLALHISDEHTDEHVPYSTDTLKLYLEDVAWSHHQEDVFRLFAADDEEKRYRFKPMKPRQRAFIHSIAEDFGFDSESLDPEPHRHVLVFKTPRFVAAPMKTLAQAARIKRAQLNIQAPVSGTSTPERRPEPAKQQYNTLLLTKPRFALTEEELRPIVHKTAATTDFDVVFLSTDDAVALLPRGTSDTPEQLTTLLSSLQPTIAAEVVKQKMAASVSLCQLDTTGYEPTILHQQSSQSGVATNGWSQVAARRGTPMQAPKVQPIGQKPVYTVLGSRLAEAKKKKQENEELLRRKAKIMEDAPEDWEQEADEDDQSAKNAIEEQVAPGDSALDGENGIDRETNGAAAGAVVEEQN